MISGTALSHEDVCASVVGASRSGRDYACDRSIGISVRILQPPSRSSRCGFLLLVALAQPSGWRREDDVMMAEQDLTQKLASLSRHPFWSRFPSAKSRGIRSGLMLLVAGFLIFIGDPVASDELPPVVIGVTSFARIGADVPVGIDQAIAELLTNELVNSQRYHVAERSRLDAVLGELGWQKDDRVNDSTAVAAGQQLGLTAMVTGSVIKLGGTMTVAARFLDVETGAAILAAQKTVVSADDIPAKISELGRDFFIKENDRARAMVNEASSLLDSGREETARTRLSAVVSRYPRTPAAPEALLLIAQTDMTSFNYTDAEKRLNDLIDTFPDHDNLEEALFRIAECYYSAVFPPPESTEAQLQNLDSLLIISTDSGDPIARTAAKNRLARKARDSYRRVLELNPETSYLENIQDRLGVLDERLGD